MVNSNFLEFSVPNPNLEQSFQYYMPKTETFIREEVLDKITGLFMRKGYSGTSMQEIVDVSGLNRSSLYNSFGDKYQLFLAALKHYKGNYEKDTVNCMKNYSPRESITVFFTKVAKAIQEKKENFQGCFITNSTAELANIDGGVAAFLSSNFQDMIDMFSDMLEKGIEIGEFKSDMDVRSTAMYLFSSLQGLQLTGMLNHSEADIHTLIKRILKDL